MQIGYMYVDITYILDSNNQYFENNYANIHVMMDNNIFLNLDNTQYIEKSKKRYVYVDNIDEELEFLFNKFVDTVLKENKFDKIICFISTGKKNICNIPKNKYLKVINLYDLYGYCFPNKQHIGIYSEINQGNPNEIQVNMVKELVLKNKYTNFNKFLLSWS
jgi:hypothetical protein